MSEGWARLGRAFCDSIDAVQGSALRVRLSLAVVLFVAAPSAAEAFPDPAGNASAWAIRAIQDDQQSFDVAAGAIVPPSGSGMIPVNFQPFTCPSGNCRQTEYDYVVTVTDNGGFSSRATRVHVTVPGTS